MAVLPIQNILAQLASERPIFHSEADFQHALAWAIHERHADYAIRLERRLTLDGKRIHVDLWVEGEEGVVPIELKYKTRALKADVEGERFDLRDQAPDLDRHDFWKDVGRLERIVGARQAGATSGYAILLTNDSSHWRDPPSPPAADADFRIQEGRRVSGCLAWGPTVSKETIKGYEDDIKLSNEYVLQWRDYSEVPAHKYGVFRNLALTVHRQA